VLETVKIRPPGFVQGYDFAVDNSIGGKIIERLGDLREPPVKVLAVPGIQNSFAVGFDSDSAIAVKFDFIGPLGASGSFETRAHSIGSINAAFLFGRDSIVVPANERPHEL
jgi:hypothetical protein